MNPRKQLLETWDELLTRAVVLGVPLDPKHPPQNISLIALALTVYGAAGFLVGYCACLRGQEEEGEESEDLKEQARRLYEIRGFALSLIFKIVTQLRGR